MKARPSVPPRRLAALLVACAGVVVAACSGDGERTGDAQRFCAEVAENRRALVRPTLETEDDVAAYVALYRSLGEHVPLEIEEQWDALTALYELASDTDVSDADARNELNALAFATEKSAVEVRHWLQQHCKVRLPITTIVDHDVKVPVSTPPTTSPAG